MKRIALDTDAVNRIADTRGVLESAQRAHAQGALVFVVSHIVIDQLAATPDPARRAALLAVYDALPKLVVPTSGAGWGVSRRGEATWGDGGESGVRIAGATTRGRGGLHDALLATTASGKADVLVTNDRELARKVRQSGACCEVWSFGRLKEFLRSQGSSAGRPGAGPPGAAPPAPRRGPA